MRLLLSFLLLSLVVSNSENAPTTKPSVDHTKPAIRIARNNIIVTRPTNRSLSKYFKLTNFSDVAHIRYFIPFDSFHLTYPVKYAYDEWMKTNSIKNITFKQIFSRSIANLIIMSTKDLHHTFVSNDLLNCSFSENELAHSVLAADSKLEIHIRNTTRAQKHLIPIIQHELGHIFGFNHTNKTNNIMNESLDAIIETTNNNSSNNKSQSQLNHEITELCNISFPDCITRMDEYVYVFHDGEIWTYNIDTNKIKYRKSPFYRTQGCTLIDHKDVLFYQHNYIRKLNLQTTNITMHKELYVPYNVRSLFGYLDNQFLLLDNNNVIKLSNGIVMWEFFKSFPHTITKIIYGFDGNFYVKTEDQSIYGFNPITLQTTKYKSFPYKNFGIQCKLSLRQRYEEALSLFKWVPVFN